MPLLRTDDAPRRLRAVWLGPRGNRLWVEWTYVQWALFVAVSAAFMGAAFLVLWPITGPGLAVGLSLWTLPWSWLLVRWVMDHADYDRPLRYWRWALRAEWRRSQRVPAVRSVRVAAPLARELPGEAASVLYTRRDQRPRPLGLTEDTA